MEELFRFMMTRPAERVDPEQTGIHVELSHAYLERLRHARRSSESRGALRTEASRHRIDHPLRHLHDLRTGERLDALLKQLARVDDISLDVLADLVRKTMGATAETVITSPELAADRETLSAALVTGVILATDGPVPVVRIAALLRVIALIERIAAQDAALEADGGLRSALELPLVLPDEIFPVFGRSATGAQLPTDNGHQQPAPEDAKTARINRLKDERDRVYATYVALTRIEPEHIAETPATTTATATAATSQPSPERREHLQPIAELPPVASEIRDTPLSHMAHAESTVTDSMTSARPSAFAALVGSSDRPAAVRDPEPMQLGAVIAAQSLRVPLVLKREVTAALRDPVRDTLAQRKLDLTSTSVVVATERLSAELQGMELELAELSAPALPVALIGKNIQPIGGLMQPLWGPAPAPVPTSHGTVAPAGIGDLLVVRQNLKRYEGRELAHVENVLKGEYKERIHSRARTTEETSTVEIETKREEERDQQSTERFELKTESSEVIKQDTSLKLGASVSGKYGPVVEFKASADFAMNNAKEESTKVATTYSKDVTARATSRLFERRREERILKTIEVFKEENKHGIDNKDGAGHVVGQYQWIDKVYEAQVFNYGKRLLFDIMLPEPAAFLLHATANQTQAGADLIKPLPFTLVPSQITEWNYGTYVKQYGAAGVEAPPLPYVTVGKAEQGKGTENDGATKAMELVIPDGYQALSGFVGVWYTRWSGASVDVTLGRKMNRFTDNGGWFPTLSNEAGTIPFALKTFKASDFVAAVEVTCQRTDRALNAWKLKTHTSIMQAYQKQLRDYEEQLAAAEVEAGIQIQGRNPVENERLIRAELKKGALSVFTAQHFDLFNSITFSAQGYPQPNLTEAEAEGKYIRFFEQAFEWEQMMYFFYPYFWGRKNGWRDRALLQDTDPLFAEFIKAGSTRVVVSVRPGFEQALIHFLDTGTVWDGGDLPEVTSPLYLSIIQEIRERDQAPGAEVAAGSPWDVRLPTTLLTLRNQAALPAWQKDAAGEWQPA